ncbi:MAG: MiaB/RimO family radical SAM methylthiotransferase [Candidatus Aminicenantes bacterium]|nr:MAG: MiaB/RimO family radical SAM methylthiotransferase [Candidatus Aminicenantes bacterium]
MKFYVNYFGCRANQAEIQEWIIQLENSGYQLTTNISEADFGILNTCSVTERAEKDIYRFINRVYKNTNIKWIITGCTVSKEKQVLPGRYKNYYFYDNEEKKHLVDRVKELFPVDSNIIYHSAYRSRIFLKIHDGCNFRCSFCIVPFLRGKAISLPASEVIAKAKYYVSLGYREIVLSGINLSSYGYDLFPRDNLLDLVKELNKIRGLAFIRLSSLDPRYIRYNFIKELSYTKKLAASFHFSLQSASNLILKRMKRGSKSFEYRKMLDQFLHFFPEANFGADILVGFPGETDKEFRETLNFTRESPLTYIHIFPFSPRRDTKAALMEQVPPNIVQKRVNELKETNKLMRINYRERFRDKVLAGILTEENPNYSLIITKNYLSVRVPPIKGFKKKKVKVKINRVVNENLCEGTIVK